MSSIFGGGIAPEHLLEEIEDVLRNAPPRATMGHYTADNLAWRGRASAAVAQWDSLQAVYFDTHIANLAVTNAQAFEAGYNGTMVMLNKVRADLRMRVHGPKNVAIGQGQVFDYFDELRRAIEPARKECFFVDPYLDAEFVARYMPYIHSDAATRLLTSSKSAQQLLPAIEAFSTQSKLQVFVRTTNSIHDRYLFIDGEQCYHSGASFKDGAKRTPTTLNQITDAFAPVLKTYDDLWASGTVVRE